jgi:hypothetical protein
MAGSCTKSKSLYREHPNKRKARGNISKYNVYMYIYKYENMYRYMYIDIYNIKNINIGVSGMIEIE